MRGLKVAVFGAGLVLAGWLLCTPATADQHNCSQASRENGTCTVTAGINGDQAVINGTQPGAPGGSTSGGGGGGAGASASEPAAPCTAGCIDPFVVTSLPTPTLRDLVGFRPTPGVDHMEPNGWFVVGLDANFYSTGGASVQNGTLLGYPASVRFTPIRWSWAYGDGSSATRSTRGTTWAAQGIAEFDPTPTSHVYEAAGTYYIDLSIGYRAEYSFNGSSWGAIDGILWLPANRLVATVGGAKTVLVERECTTPPAGPGC